MKNTLRNLFDQHGCKPVAVRITPQKLFLSEEFHSWLDSFILGVLGHRVEISVFYDSDNDTVAYTDGQRIVLNAGNAIANAYRSLSQKALANVGIVAHECAHKLYLNFKEANEATNALENGFLFGENPIAGALNEEERAVLDELTTALKDEEQRQIFIYVYHTIDNIVADAHDEACICRDFGGLIPPGITLAAESMRASCPSYEDMLDESKWDPLTRMFQLLLEMARFDDFFALDDDQALQEESIQRLVQLLPYLESARSEDDYQTRSRYINRCLLVLWPYIKDALEQADKDDDQKDNDSSHNGQQGQQQGGGQSSASNASDNSQQGQQGEQGQGSQSQPSSSQQGGQQKGQEDSSSGSGQQSKQPSGQDAGQDGAKPDNSSGPQESSQGSQPSSTPSPEAVQRVLEKLKAGAKGGTAQPVNQPLNQTPEEVEQGIQTAISQEAAQSTMKSLEKAVTERALQEKMENSVEDALEKDFLTEVQTANQSSSHRGLSIRTERSKTVSAEDIARYDRIMEKVRPFSKQMQKRVGRILEDLRDGSIEHHKSFGRQIEAKESFRRDGKFFANKKQPQDLPDMAIAVLVDQSGSMSGSRMKAAMEAAILLDDFATGLGIPVSVIGHNTKLKQIGTALYPHALFERAGNKDRYRLAQMTPNASNRDGMALHIVADMLAKRPEEIKLLIIISDGQPNDIGYGGSEARNDIRKIVAAAKTKGVQVFAAAIGDDKDKIRDIYGEGFLDVSDLSSLPKTMVRLISKRII